ncbi:MAG: glycosyltransferase family 2 protein [Acidobacteriota bacterium]
MNAIKLEIVTPVHNRKAETLRCLKSLSRSKLDGIETHVIIVDDGSTDGTADAVRAEYPDVEIVQGSGDLWYTAGTNRGLEAALRHDPDFILAINNDQIFDENCVRRLVECAGKYPRSVVGSLLLDWDEPPKIFQVAPKWSLWGGGYRHWRNQTVWTAPDRPWEVELIVGNCVLYPAAAVCEVGFMDEKKLVQYGDAEYTPRMRRRGWRLLIEPKARVFCQPNVEISGFRQLPLREKFSQIFLKPSGPYSVRRRYHSTIGGAPSVLQGMIAIPVFYLRVLFGRNLEGKWGSRISEPPLAETYSSKVVRNGGNS